MLKESQTEYSQYSLGFKLCVIQSEGKPCIDVFAVNSVKCLKLIREENEAKHILLGTHRM